MSLSDHTIPVYRGIRWKENSEDIFELYGQDKENIKMSAWQALKKAH
jgi:hypothetical protein